MRHTLLALSLLLLSLFSYGQMAPGTPMPDFTLKDINGNTHNLYRYLDSGYAVMIDISASWCGPCWDCHQSHLLDSLDKHYGPNGTVSPKKIKVLFIEGDPTNTRADLYGPNRDWVTGTQYPIIDTDALNVPLNLVGYPTFAIICRDRLVNYWTAGFGAADRATEQYWLDIVNRECPAVPPATGSAIDAKAVAYADSTYYFCSPTPTLSFQNYSRDATLTSATIRLYERSNVVGTIPWTGSLSPFEVASVRMPRFTAQTAGPFRFDVTATGDVDPANNGRDSLFRVINRTTARPTPCIEEFTGLSDYNLPANYIFDYNQYFYTATVYGPLGQNTDALLVLFNQLAPQDQATVCMGNYDISHFPRTFLNFDYCFAPRVANSADRIRFEVSTDCGLTWRAVWDKTGNALATHAPYNGVLSYSPTAASDWRKVSVDLSAYRSDNLLVNFSVTSDDGNPPMFDNISFSQAAATGVAPEPAAPEISIYPNPATGSCVLETPAVGNDISYELRNMVGQPVRSGPVPGVRTVLDLSGIPDGVYSVAIMGRDGVIAVRKLVKQ